MKKLKVILKGEPKEIAALVVGLQGRMSLEVAGDATIKDIANANSFFADPAYRPDKYELRPDAETPAQEH